MKSVLKTYKLYIESKRIMENKDLFLQVADHFEQCVLTGDEKLIEDTRREVCIILDFENCKRIVESTPHLAYKDVLHSNL
jgi:methyl coenzyme M reductase subunit C-like uncharacterized protein (methanogenesis marker protein 7)